MKKKKVIAIVIALGAVFATLVCDRVYAYTVVDETYDEINMVGKYELSFAVGSNVYGFCKVSDYMDIYGDKCNDPVRLQGDNGGRITAVDKSGNLLGAGGNSSSSVLSKPSSNARIIKAYLMQQAFIERDRENALIDHAMTLKGPKGGTIKPRANKVFVSDRSLNSIGVTYVDVTSFVKSQGFGTYQGWDIAYVQRPKAHKADDYASWRLVVICEDESLPIRMLRMKMGSGSTTGKTITLNLDGDGFVTKSNGNVTGQIIIGGGGGDTDSKSSKFDFCPSASSPITHLNTGTTGKMNTEDGFLQAIVTHNGIPRNDVRILGYRPSDHTPVHNTDLIMMDVNSTQSNAQNGHNAYFVNNSNQITLSAITENGYKGNLDLFGILADIDSATYNSSMSHSNKLYKNTDITMKAYVTNNTQVNKPKLGVTGGYALINVDSNLSLDADTITAVYTHNGVKKTLPKSMITVSGNSIKVIFGSDSSGKSYRGDTLDITFHGSTEKENITIKNNTVMYATNWIDENGTGHAFSSLTTMTTAQDSFKIEYNNPPIINASNKTYYDSDYTQKEWVDQLRMENVTAGDVEDGNITSKIAITSDNTVMDKPGTYQVTYQVTDSVGNVTSKTTTVTIKHNNPPVISASNKTFYYDEYTLTEWLEKERMEDVTASDIEDGNVTSKVKILSDNVDPTIPGHYQVTYQVTDSHKKMATKTIDVEVLYNHAPVINSSSFSFHENEYSNDEWKEEFMKQVSADDQEDGDLTNKVTIKSSNVNPDVPGAYEVVLTVTDSRGKTTERTVDVTVLDNWAPTIQIFAGNKRFIEGQYTQDEWESELRMLGVSAHDREDADLTDKITIKKDTTDPSKSGLYQVTYKVSDRWGKTAEKTVSVIVEPNDPPQIFAYDKYFTTKDHISTQELMKNVTAVDDRDGDISDDIEIVYNGVTEGVVGTYQVTYRVTDAFNKTTEKTVSVHIRDGETPVPVEPPVPSTALRIWNGRELAKLSITKEMEASLFDHDDAYKEVVFGVYAAEDIMYQDEVVLKKDSLVGISKLNELKQIDVMLYHTGDYYLKELSTDDHYQLDDNIYYFHFAYEGKEK